MSDITSIKLTESLKILFLLKGDLMNDIGLLKDSQVHSVGRAALKCLYIDLCSFIDELKKFKKILFTGDFDNYNSVNTFLLASHQARKLIDKHEKGLSKLRNTIFAHNYRDKSNDFVDPLMSLLVSFEHSPLFIKQLKFIATAAVLVCSLALDGFHFNRNLALSQLVDSSRIFEKAAPEIEKRSKNSIDLTIRELYKEVYHIKDALKSHQENYKIISEKINCKLRER